MSSSCSEDAATARLRAVLTGLDSDLEHLRQLRAADAAPDAAERALRTRGESEAAARTVDLVSEDDDDGALAS